MMDVTNEKYRIFKWTHRKPVEYPKKQNKRNEYNSSDDFWKLFDIDLYRISPKVCQSFIASINEKLNMTPYQILNLICIYYYLS